MLLVLLMNCALNPVSFLSEDELYFKKYPLVKSSGWHKASIPLHILDNDSIYWAPPVWHQYWYNPISNKEKTFSGELFKEYTNLYLTSLRFVIAPCPNDSFSNIYISNNVNPVAGIMIPLKEKLTLQELYSDTIILDFYAKSRYGCKLYIDIGEIGEDISLNGGPPNGWCNYEKRNALIGEYDSKCDLGLDSLQDESEFCLMLNFSDSIPFFDTLFYGDSILGQFIFDPSKDNYKIYNEANLNNNKYANGLENDGRITSEDIDHNYIMERHEKFYRATIDFSDLSNCKFVINDNSIADTSKWKHFRIFVCDTINLDIFGGILSKNELKIIRFSVSNFKSENFCSYNIIEFTDINLNFISSPEFYSVWIDVNNQTVLQINQWGIVPGSETVMNERGEYLKRYVDYVIDCSFGQITLISDKAKRSTKLFITYLA